ncbi:DUF3788 domain-containing protein [Pannonibacter phragmitetus]|uniref:DUF3788 domain-containing protein n=1 Tax=Pannonibacter phragmitetus TaxID=121719 RepID=A0A0U3EQJ9_9HYPH|nr:DUF3788 domain-containing protein [Pannonibacter phragmitetus]ALV28527.1 hypothetical protein APZ00_16850 [Pannonibacter phragmitetus]
MDQSPQVGDRLTNKSAPPSDETVRDWTGLDAFARWKALQDWIENTYPGTFIPEWIYGGKKHGWSLRYKKSRAFCTFLPEYGLFSVVVVLGRPERDKLEARRKSLSSQLADLYDSTPTYRDGKWLKIGVSTADDLRDLTQLLTIKRPPRSRH